MGVQGTERDAVRPWVATEAGWLGGHALLKRWRIRCWVRGCCVTPPRPAGSQTLLSYCRCLLPKSCPILWDPQDCSPPGSSVHGISQARILEWVAISFSRGSSRPRDTAHISCLAGRFFTTEPPGKPLLSCGRGENTISFRVLYVDALVFAQRTPFFLELKYASGSFILPTYLEPGHVGSRHPQDHIRLYTCSHPVQQLGGDKLPTNSLFIKCLWRQHQG